MAMLERRDRSSYYDSLNAKAKSAQNEATAENAMTRAKNSTIMERRSIERNRQNIQAGLNIAGAIKGMISDAFTVGTGDLSPIVGEQLNAIIHQGQMADADTDLLSIVTEGKGLAESSIADGSSTFTMVTDENGKQQLQFTPAQSVTDWYEGAMKQIDDSSYLPDVKAAMKKSLNANYYSMVQGMQSSAIERSYQSIQAGFETKINADLVSDAQLWAQYDGKKPADVFYAGSATIAGRTDWTDEEKANYAASYIQQVQRQGIQERATQIAMGSATYVDADGNVSTGLEAARKYIYGQKSLTSDDKRSFYSKAMVSYNQLEGAYKTEAEIPDTTRVWGVPLGRRFFREVRSIDVYATIGRYRGPVLLLHGDHDDIVPIDYSRRAARTYADAELHTIHGARHGFGGKAREEAVARVAAFLSPRRQGKQNN